MMLMKLSEYTYNGYDYKVKYRHLDDIYYYNNFDVEDTWDAYGYDQYTDTNLVWHHYTPSEINDLEHDVKVRKIANMIAIGALGIILAALLAPAFPISAVLVTIGFSILEVLISERYDQLEEFVENIKAERGDGWSVYKIKGDDAYFVPGKEFWKNPINSPKFIKCANIE
ncbi:MAG: hypothetical protein ACTSRR_02245 [Candidatus Heimdallarchaeaceae archaeon]